MSGAMITDPEPNFTVAPGTFLSVTVDSTQRLNVTKVFVGSTFDAVLAEGPLPVTVSLEVPPDAIGPISLFADVWEEGTGNIIMSGKITGTVVPSAQLISLRLTPDPMGLYDFSPTESLFVFGLYDDDVEREITEPSFGTIFESDNPAIAEVSNDGLVTSVAAGVTFITVTNGTLAETVDVIVYSVPPIPGDLNGDGLVDTFDLFILLGAWGACDSPCPPSCPEDLTNSTGDGMDCTVNTFDLFVLLANWTN